MVAAESKNQGRGCRGARGRPSDLALRRNLPQLVDQVSSSVGSAEQRTPPRGTSPSNRLGSLTRTRRFAARAPRRRKGGGAALRWARESPRPPVSRSSYVLAFLPGTGHAEHAARPGRRLRNQKLNPALPRAHRTPGRITARNVVSGEEQPRETRFATEPRGAIAHLPSVVLCCGPSRTRSRCDLGQYGPEPAPTRVRSDPCAQSSGSDSARSTLRPRSHRRSPC